MASRASGLSAFFGSDKYSDITVKFSGREFKAHKLILAAKSGWFKGAFDSSFKEASMDVIELHGDNPEALETTLQFLYEDLLPRDLYAQEPFHVRLTWYLTLYELANKYDVPSLAETTADIVHNLFDHASMRRFESLLDHTSIAHAIYTGLSLDGHGIKRGYLTALRKDVPAFDADMIQFTRDNSEFAVDILSDMWAQQSEDAIKILKCKECGFSMTLKMLGDMVFKIMDGACPDCEGVLDLSG